jgi:bla regulator protein blaR1
MRTLWAKEALMAGVALGVAAAMVSAQTQPGNRTAVADRPAFEAASVKPNKSVDAHGYSTLGRPGGHVAISDATLRQLIAQAYHFSNLSQAHYGIFGMPRWGDSEHFDIDAESPNNPTLDQKRLMLQSLLADRFKLVVRNETWRLPVYALVMVKHGHLGQQLRPHRDDVPCSPRSALPTAPQSTSVSHTSAADAAAFALEQFPCGRIVGGMLQQAGPNPAWSGGRNVTMEEIAESLGADEYIDRSVLDRTGLKGRFDFTIEWNTEQQNLSANPQPLTQGLSLFEALADQLGLKVKAEKGPVSVLVVDHVEPPSEN